MDNPLEHWTIEDSKQRYLEHLAAIREKRLHIEEKVRSVRKQTDGIKHGTVRNILEKKLAKLDKCIADLDARLDKADALFKEVFK